MLCVIHRGRDGSRMHYGKKAGRRKPCYALHNDLLGKLGSCIHVDVTLTCTTNLNIFADHIRTFHTVLNPGLLSF